MTIAELLPVTVGAVLVNNIVLSRILGICPFLGVSKKLKTALGMGCAVTFVMTISSFVTAVLYHFLLKQPLTAGSFKNLDLSFARTLVFIVVIASLVQIVEILMQKFSKSLYQALGIYLPLITTNCAVLGAAELNAASGRGIILSTIYGCCSGLGFALALLLFASIRERLELSRIPKIFQGASIALVTAGILAMAFMGFAGLVK
ncbi:MAG: RnfABCDGE type electron transport complex subunit A [Lentisphaeria bacterium]|nr:RnfABCDGE type electron transport complex subunit A [Lentisphaeria bacterium]